MLPAGSLGTKLRKCEISNVFIKHSQIPVGVSRMSYSHLHSALSLQDAEGTCGHTHGHAHTCAHTQSCTHTQTYVCMHMELLPAQQHVCSPAAPALPSVRSIKPKPSLPRCVPIATHNLLAMCLQRMLLKMPQKRVAQGWR